MKRRLSSALVFIPFLAFLSSCFTTANFETGRTVGRGMYKHDIGINFETSTPKTNGWFDFNEAPFVNYGISYGLLDRLDIGFNINQTDLSIKSKFMLTKPTSTVSVSLGSSVFFLFPQEEMPEYFHTNLTLFTSLHPTDEFTFYLNPQLIFMVDGSLENRAYGITAGFIFNKIFKTRKHSIGFGFEYTGHEMGIYKQNTFAFGIIIKRNKQAVKYR